MTMSMNRRALWLVEAILAHAQERRVVLHLIEGGGRYIDCGIEARGGLLAGLELARLCMGELASVEIVPGELAGRADPDRPGRHRPPGAGVPGQPVRGLGDQRGQVLRHGVGARCAPFAGRSRSTTSSGSARSENSVVGVLETRKPPPPSVVAAIAAECKVTPASVTLLAAPTASLAGGVQVVARSVETALHKLAELKFDLGRIQSAHGIGAAASGGARTTWRPSAGPTTRSSTAVAWSCYVTGDDASLEQIGPKVPSSSSRDFGEPFAAIFARYNNDFYAVDPLLFSPAEVVFQNLETGRSHAFGGVNPEVLERSFWS